MKCFVTDSTRRFESVQVSSRYNLRTPEMRLVKVYSSVSYQSIVGFGAALTESSAYVFSKMPSERKRELLELCFGQSGNRYSLCRLVIQSSDFSLGPRSYMESANDTKLESFSIDSDREYELPFIKAVLNMNSNIEFLASPWSPPAWAKTNRNMCRGGRLRRSKYRIWAKMMARYLSAYRNEGVKINRITVQNEPHARQTWESCLFSAGQEIEFAVDYLRPALDEAGLGDVRILLWDQNKEGLLDRAQACHASPKGGPIDGFAFHWYSGDHFEALAATRDLIGENRDLIFSEGCDSYSDGDPACELPHAEHYAREIIGDLNAGANGAIDWNILLDSRGGPNHVGNFCDAPIMYDYDQDTLNVRLPFIYLGHFSRFVKPGSRRILVSSFTNRLMTCAFKCPDRTKVAIILNPTTDDISFEFCVEEPSILPNKSYQLVSRSHSIMTLVMD